MNQRQRENTAKYLYDLSKGSALIAVVGNIVSEKRRNIMDQMTYTFLVIIVIGLLGIGWTWFWRRWHRRH